MEKKREIKKGFTSFTSSIYDTLLLLQFFSVFFFFFKPFHLGNYLNVTKDYFQPNWVWKMKVSVFLGFAIACCS